ncbi:MAG TPA: CHASE2 domain-containing protein [Polyangiaceae bacterium]|nr:CHASE2 domain-containing protein [Polyangiaceae bacterium]
MAKGSTSAGRWKPRAWTAALTVAYLAVVVLLVGLEFREDFMPFGEAATKEATIDEADALAYRLFTRAGYRTHRARYAHVVLLSPQTEGERVFYDLCTQRSFLGDVVENLLNAGVSGIVIDKHFGRGVCPKDDPGTAHLVEVLTTSRVPVVIGIRCHDTSELDREAPVVLEESRLFEPDQAATPVDLGLMLLNQDTKKIPLEWPVMTAAGSRPFPTLAFAAARHHDPRVQDDLKDLLASGRHPFAAFIDPRQFPATTAARVYCMHPSREYDGIDCGRAEQVPRAELSGRVAIIGDDSSTRDRHSSAVGEIAGVFLHANYVEALLDDRYYRALPRGPCIWATICLGVLFALWFLGMESPEKALLGCIGFLAVLSGIGHLMLVELRYLPPLPEIGGLLTFTIFGYVHACAHRFHEKREDSMHPPPPPRAKEQQRTSRGER